MTLRIALFAIIYAAGIISGIAFQQKAFNQDPVPCPECPSLTCPPATEVNLQTLDMEGLRRIKGDFNYNPSLSNVIVKINCPDSVLLKEMLKKGL